jgi:CDP-diacylglycerol--glycerol-3-phosphate 3-phosphatidyltransferase
MYRSSAKYDLLMAHPKANGFLGAKGPAGGIPAAYTLIAKMFFDLLTRNRLHDRLKMFEYQKEGETDL